MRAAIIWPASGFLKSILRSDFVCFKFLIGTVDSRRTELRTLLVQEVAAPSARWDHRKSKFGLRQGIKPSVSLSFMP